MVGRTALLNANVVYPVGLRDLLPRPTDCYLFAPLWNADIYANGLADFWPAVQI